MTKPVRSLPQQIAAVKHAMDVLRSDEDVAPALDGARATLEWLEKKAETVKAVVAFTKAVRRDDALDILEAFTELAREEPEIADLLREFRNMKERHPEIISVLQQLRDAGMAPAKVELKAGAV